MTLRLIHFNTVMAAFLTCITGTCSIHAADQVPDNQVWTPATATFFYGQQKANITCKFLGTPYGVYWMKDPDQVSIFTEPSVTGWAGSSISLQCRFIGTPERVLWNKVQGDHEATSVETILRYTSDGYEVLGERRYSWSDNYGLIIRDVQVFDKGNFTCMVSKTGGTEIENTTVVAVNARAEKPYLQIHQCKSQPGIMTNGTTPKPCLYNMTKELDSFELQCLVIRAKPKVDILWQEGSTNLTSTTIVTKRADGAYDVTATITRMTSQTDLTFTCIASGLAVNGTAQRTVIVRRIKGKKPKKKVKSSPERKRKQEPPSMDATRSDQNPNRNLKR